MEIRISLGCLAIAMVGMAGATVLALILAGVLAESFGFLSVALFICDGSAMICCRLAACEERHNRAALLDLERSLTRIPSQR